VSLKSEAKVDRTAADVKTDLTKERNVVVEEEENAARMKVLRRWPPEEVGTKAGSSRNGSGEFYLASTTSR